MRLEAADQQRPRAVSRADRGSTARREAPFSGGEIARNRWDSCGCRRCSIEVRGFVFIFYFQYYYLLITVYMFVEEECAEIRGGPPPLGLLRAPLSQRSCVYYSCSAKPTDGEEKKVPALGLKSTKAARKHIENTYISL